MARHPRTPKPDDAPYPPGWEPFLAAINADLDDDTVRLVFADWLQENGDEARAEFIRIQCAVTGGGADWGGWGSPSLAGTPQTNERLGELAARHRKRWSRQLPHWALKNAHHCYPKIHYGFRRGFLYAFDATAGQWLQHGGRVRHLTPVGELRLRKLSVHETTLFRDPSLWGLRAISISNSREGVPLSSTGAHLIADPRIISSLVALEVPGPALSTDALSALFGTPHLSHLRDLWLTDTPHGNHIARELSTNSSATNLQRLRLSTTRLDAKAFEQFVTSQTVLACTLLTCMETGFAMRASVPSSVPTFQHFKNSTCQITT